MLQHRSSFVGQGRVGVCEQPKQNMKGVSVSPHCQCECGSLVVNSKRHGDRSLLDKFASAKKRAEKGRTTRRQRTLSLVQKTRSYHQQTVGSGHGGGPGAGVDTHAADAAPAADEGTPPQQHVSRRVTRSVFHKDVKSSFRREVGGRLASKQQATEQARRSDAAEYSSTVVAIRMVEKKTRAMKLHAVANR